MAARTPRGKLQRVGDDEIAPTSSTGSRRRKRSERSSLRLLVATIVTLTHALAWATDTVWMPSAMTAAIASVMYRGHFKGLDPAPTHLTRRWLGVLPAGMLRMHAVTAVLIVWAWCIGTGTLAAARWLAEAALGGTASSWALQWALQPAWAHSFVFAPAVLLVGGGASFGPLRGTVFRTFYDPPVFAAVFFFHYVVGDKLNSLATRMAEAAGGTGGSPSVGGSAGGRRKAPPPQARLLLGALPFASDVPELKALGVRAVVNMCDEWPGPAQEYHRHGIEQLRLPTIDGSSPTAEVIAAGVAFARSHLAAGPLPSGQDAVLVHCRCGMGRSATVMLACLVALGGEEPDAALARMKQRRPEVANSVVHAASFEAWLSSHRATSAGGDSGASSGKSGKHA